MWFVNWPYNWPVEHHVLGILSCLMIMPSSSRLIALVQLIKKWGHKLNLKREMEMLKLMWEHLRVSCMLQRVSWPFLPDALAKRWIYLGVTPPIKFNCFPWGSPCKSLLSWMKGASCLRMCDKGMAIGTGGFHITLFGMWTCLLQRWW